MKLTLRWLSLALLPAAFVQFTASAQTGLGGYDLKSPADQAFAFDYNGTGKLDHIVLYRPGSQTIFIEEKQPNGTYFPVMTSFSGIGGYDLRSTADRIIAFDYSGNGHADHLLCYRPGTGTVWILENKSGMFYPVYMSTSGIGGYDLMSTNDKIITFDYNGSGRYDHLVLYRPGSGNVFIVRHGSGTSFSPVFTSSTGIGGYDMKSTNDLLIAFDYYSVGIGDHLLAYRPGGGTAFVLENVNGSGSFSAVQTSFTGFGGFDLKVANDRLLAFDYTGSGNPNHILAYRPGTGVAWMLENSYLTYNPIVQSTNGIGGYDLKSTADSAFALDYYSTGLMTNLALYRPGSSIFFIQTKNGTLTNLAQESTQSTF